MSDQTHLQPPKLPRVAITYCTQCKWLLRAAYFAQELLSTFSTTIGEVALIPATGGLFTVYLTHSPPTTTTTTTGSSPHEVLIWDRKAEGGFPETKILKQRIRNYIEPERNLGHSDTPSKSKEEVKAASSLEGDVVVGKAKADEKEKKCEDCA